jgi:hypothetical protein
MAELERIWTRRSLAPPDPGEESWEIQTRALPRIPMARMMIARAAYHWIRRRRIVARWASKAAR